MKKKKQTTLKTTKPDKDKRKPGKDMFNKKNSSLV